MMTSSTVVDSRQNNLITHVLTEDGRIQGTWVSGIEKDTIRFGWSIYSEPRLYNPLSAKVGSYVAKECLKRPQLKEGVELPQRMATALTSFIHRSKEYFGVDMVEDRFKQFEKKEQENNVR